LKLKDQLTPWSRVLDKQTGLQLVKSGPCPSGLPTKILCAPHPSCICAVCKLFIILKNVVGNEMGLLAWCYSRYETAEGENTVRERELMAWMLFVSDVRNEMKHSMISLG